MNRSAAAFVPRVAAVFGLGLLATVGAAWAAASGLPKASVPTAAAPTRSAPLVVPDVRAQAFAFAKGTLEDAGFAWRVGGSVHGYPANTVVSQSPLPGTRVLDTGAPLVTLTLKPGATARQRGVAEDSSPYGATALTRLSSPATTVTAAQPARTAPARTTPARTSRWPQHRPPAFAVPGGKKEPLDEMPLPDRALALGRWLDWKPRPTDANVKHWLYQNAWIVSGAKLGWWRGADALRTLVAVDRRAQALWGVGAKSAAAARRALSEVQAASKR